MTVLVTGASGFIGSRLVQTLSLEMRHVVGVDLDLPKMDPQPSDFHQVDFGDSDTVFSILMNYPVDTVCHAGWVGRPYAEDRQYDVSWNLAKSVRFIETCQKAGVQRFIFLSSGAVYGNASYFPTAEGAATVPVSSYAATKMAVEHYLRLSEMETICLRPTGVYGPGEEPYLRPSVITAILWRALHGETFHVLGDGLAERQPLYVDDLLRAIRLILTCELMPSELNLAGKESSTVLGLVREAEKVLGQKIAIEFKPPSDQPISKVELNCQAAKESLGWEPAVSLADGMKQTANYLRTLMR